MLFGQEARDRDAPGDVVWTRSKKKIEMPQVMWLFGQEASKRVAPGDVMVLFGERREKKESPSCG